MMHAYDKLYLDKARTALARMLDFAVYDLHYDISEFFELFSLPVSPDALSRGISLFSQVCLVWSLPIRF